MTTGAILIEWGASIPGREMKAIEVFGMALEQSEKDLKAGHIHGHKEYFTVVGSRGGFQIIDGELDSLLAVVGDEDHRRLFDQCRNIVEDFSVSVYEGGSDATVQEGVTRYVDGMRELGLTT